MNRVLAFTAVCCAFASLTASRSSPAAQQSPRYGSGAVRRYHPITTQNLNGCKIVVSGALSGTSGCSAMIIFDSDKGVTGITINGPTTFGQVMIGATLQGDAHTGTIDASNATHLAAVVQSSSMGFWNCEGGSESADKQAGNLTITLTSIGDAQMVGAGKIYSAHGTVAAACPAAQGLGASGTINLNASF